MTRTATQAAHRPVARADVQGTKQARTIYWITTGIVCAVMVFSIVTFVFHDRFPFPDGKEGAFVHLGLPPYFKAELTIAKIFGVLALLIPSVPYKIKEFAYAGFAITLLSAAVAHFSVGDAHRSILYIVDPLAFFCVLVVSYSYFTRLFGAGRPIGSFDS